MTHWNEFCSLSKTSCRGDIRHRSAIGLWDETRRRGEIDLPREVGDLVNQFQLIPPIKYFIMKFIVADIYTHVNL